MTKMSLIAPTGPALSQLVEVDAPNSAGPGGTADDPVGELRLGWIVIIAFFGIFLGWASLAPLDAAATAEGSITVSGHRQTVQHRDGGSVSSVHVREGQHVKAGEVLIELAPSDLQGAERAASSQLINLQALRARLLAEQTGRNEIATPAEFASLSAEDKVAADAALQRQRTEMLARNQAMASQRAVLQQRQAQIGSQIAGINGQMESADKQSRLLNDELAATRKLAEQGYASTNRLRALERNAASLSGSKSDLTTGIARSQQQIGEMRAQSLGMMAQRSEEIARDLQSVEQAISELIPKLLPLRQRVSDATIRAPATGTVVALTVFSPGALVAPGQRVLDIVPDAAPLVVEAKLSPNDIADVNVGQGAQVRLAALHDRTLPILNGKITQLSADTFTDERTGAKYYTAEITVPVAQVAALRKAEGRDSGIKPGLPVQIMISLRKRSALEYLLEPLTQSMWTSMHQR
jgi:HlyD family secretion protein